MVEGGHEHLNVHKAYDMVWCDGLCVNLWGMGVKGMLWCVIKNMYEVSRKYHIVRGGQVGYI